VLFLIKKGEAVSRPGAHSQARSLDELNKNLHEVIEMLLEDGEPSLQAQFVGIQTVTVS